MHTRRLDFMAQLLNRALLVNQQDNLFGRRVLDDLLERARFTWEHTLQRQNLTRIAFFSSCLQLCMLASSFLMVSFHFLTFCLVSKDFS